jgi:hypothetical protein
MAGTFSTEKRGPQTNQGAVILRKTACVQVVGEKNKHLTLRLFVSAEGIQPLRFAEEIFCHFQLPGREKTGGCLDVFANASLYFVPQFCQKKPVFTAVGDFFNVASIQFVSPQTVYHGILEKAMVADGGSFTRRISFS